MANVFERMRDYLNQPLPGAPAKKKKAAEAAAPVAKPKPADVTAAAKPPAGAPAAAPAKPAAAQDKAPDVQAQLRKRELAIRRAQAKADAQMRQKLEAERKALDELRHQYEAELAKQAAAHTEREEWTHTVVPGDTLSGIARKYYGSAARWPEIFEANKDKIQNPNLIYPGQVFVIPDRGA